MDSSSVNVNTSYRPHFTTGGGGGQAEAPGRAGGGEGVRGVGEFFTTVFVPLVFGYLLVGFAIYWERGSPKFYRTLLLLLLLCVVCVVSSLYTAFLLS